MKRIILAAAALALGLAPGVAADEKQTIQGRTFVFRYGSAYELVKGRERFIKTLYEPGAVKRSFRTTGGKTQRLLPDKSWAPVLRTFKEDFEGVAMLRRLVSPSRGWTGFTLQSPQARTAAQAAALQDAIMEGHEEFRDNRLEPVPAAAKNGKGGLRALAVPPGPNLTASKASLDTQRLYIRQGEEFWLAAWIKVAKGPDMEILSLESGFIEENPGLRLTLTESLEPRLEMRWLENVVHSAAEGARLPRNKWVRLRLHIKVFADPRGRLELWVDDKKALEAKGQTLPLPDAVYDVLRIGIPSLGTGGEAAVHWDDLVFGPAPVK